MPRNTETFQIGFTGSTLDDILTSGWADRVVGDTQNLVVTMAGSGKDIAHLARPGRIIASWDPQPLSRYIVNGVFGDVSRTTGPLERNETKGYAYGSRPLPGMPDDAAMVVDWIAVSGDDYDRACLAKAIIRSTLMGRLGVWGRDNTAESLYRVYVKTWEGLAPWRARPGVFIHTEDSVFEDIAYPTIADGAVVYVDTPKVLTGSKAGGDIYSRGFLGLNRMLAQDDVVLPPWTEDTFRRDMPRLWNDVAFERLILFHASGCRPTIQEVQDMLEGDGLDIRGMAEWEHKGRTDIAFVVDR